MGKPFTFITSIILIFFLVTTNGQAVHWSLQADGADNYVVIGPTPDLDIPSVSIDCWVKLLKLPEEAGAHFIWNGDERPSNDSYTLGADWKGKVMAVGNFNGGFNFRSKSTLQLNRWTHLALTIDDKEKRVKLYIDGELDTETSYNNTLPVGYSFLTFGAGFDGHNVHNQPYFGLLDEVRIFDYPRSSIEIKATMNIALVGNEPGLVGYWRFDVTENEFTASDYSPNAHHGSLFGDEAFIESDLQLSYLRGEINTADGWQVVIANHPAKFVLTTTIIGMLDSPPVTTIDVILPEELSKAARLEGAVTYDGEMVSASSFQSGRVLTIQLTEGISTGQLEIRFVAEVGQTEAQELTFAVILKGSDGTIVAEDVPAGDANGNPADANNFSGITLISDAPVPIPRNVEVAPARGENDLMVRWLPAEDARVRKYDIYANDEKISEITGRKKANYVHRNLTPGAKFSYSIQAIAASMLKSPPSEPIIATVGTDTTPPPPPTNIKVERLEARLIRITWASSAHDATRYDIARTESDGTLTTLKELTDGEAEYLNETPVYRFHRNTALAMKTNRAYRYVVRAYDEQDNRGDWSKPTRLKVSVTSAIRPPVRTSLWASIGVFDKGRAPHIETLAPPMDPYKGKGGQEVIWNELPLDEYEEEAGEIDWEKIFIVGKDSEAYAVTYLDSPKSQPVKFEVHQKGSSQVRMWLNGMYLKYVPDSSEFIGKLRPGRNKLLMHLSNDQGVWRSTFRILNQDGQLLKELTSISPFDVPFQPLITVKEPRPWAPEQATGPPDMTRGDGKAYGAARPEEGLVWIYLTYGMPMHARQVRIFEVYSPGAVAKVELYDEEKKAPHLVWEGIDPTNKAPDIFDVFFPQTEYRVTGVKITLDTDRVSGYDDIDAVQLVGAEGEQWATGAVASSFWAAGKYMQTQMNALSMTELVEHLKFDGAPNTRRQSAERLKSQLRDASLPFLKDALSDPDAGVRISVIQELAKLESESAVDTLIDQLRNRSQDFSEDAHLCLAFLLSRFLSFHLVNLKIWLSFVTKIVPDWLIAIPDGWESPRTKTVSLPSELKESNLPVDGTVAKRVPLVSKAIWAALVTSQSISVGSPSFFSMNNLSVSPSTKYNVLSGAKAKQIGPNGDANPSTRGVTFPSAVTA